MFFAFDSLTDESRSIAESTTTKNILRIVTDKNCLCYFVQYLEQKSALPLIKFWLDAESFKSSAKTCIDRGAHHVIGKRVGGHRRTKSLGGNNPNCALGKSISLDCGISAMRDECVHDDLTSLNSSTNELDEEMSNGIQSMACTMRDSGDGSSEANSMTNLSDICEQDGEIESTKLNATNSMERDEVDATAQHKQFTIEAEETGRKSAIGAAADECNGTETMESQTVNAKRSSNFQTSLIMDAMRIFKKYLLNRESATYVDVPATIQSRISLALGAQQSDGDGNRHANDNASSIGSIFDDAQSYVLDYLDSTFTNAFLESSFYCRYCVEILSGDSLRIADILHNEAALFYFMEFLENENKRLYLDFWLAAMNFKRQLDEAFAVSTAHAMDDAVTDPSVDIDSQQAQNDALILYEKYFSLQATCPLHLSDRVRFQIEEKICSIDGGASIAHSFDLPLAIIERFLEQRFLRAFVKSPLFFKYLSELLQKIDTNKAQAMDRKATELMTASASPVQPQGKDFAGAISSKNTLLAMESSKKRSSLANQRIRSTSTSDMSIDARQLRDPDMLWRRSSLAGPGLNFGRVDALGRYERDYEMVPFAERGNNAGGLTPSATHTPAHPIHSVDTGLAALQNTGNKIKQAVRKLVHLPEDKVQEEIAWQVAEMIVKDITNVTLHTNANAPGSGGADDVGQ